MHKLHQKDLLLEFPLYPDDNRKWGRVDLSPKKKIPFTLHKHVSIRIVNNEDEAAIIRVMDLLDKNDQPELGDISDLHPDKVSLTRFAAVLRRKKKSFEYPANSLNTFKHTLTGNQQIAITKSKQLAYALKLLRTRGKSKIEMRLDTFAEEEEEEEEEEELVG
ncbi:hypothetical protein J4E89_004948 [Alternaria sp. Ai002NY15]|nr:hypothetical protein J4E89_004948 [Alternaria sp. Ai002NY15]